MTTTKLNVTKVPELNKFAELLHYSGFTIIAHKSTETSTWFHFSKENKIGYVQYDRITGTNFSTVHKGNKECGTGFRITEEWADLTIENAINAFIFAPDWAKATDRNAVIKYEGVADFIKQPFYTDAIVIEPESFAVTTINNAHRLFLISGDQNTSYVCNLEDFERYYLSFDDTSSIIVQHRLNHRFVKCSKKSVIDMLKSMNLNYKFL
jgi:hypothetical protein